MRYTFLLLLFLSISIQSSGQEEKERLFGGGQINTRVLFISPYYEVGNNRINHRGLSGGFGIYKNLYVGVYGQWGKWESESEENNFESKYSQGGLLIGHVSQVKKSKFSFFLNYYLGRGKSTSEQDTPISFTDAQIQFNVLTPEIGLEYRFMRFGTLMISGGRHFYWRTDQDDSPVGFNGFDLNQNFGKISLRFGI